MQAALKESHAALKLLVQRAVDVFAVKITRIAQMCARKPHRANLANRQMPLWMLAKQQHARQVGHSALRQLEIFQKLGHGQARCAQALAKAPLEVAVKGPLVDVGHGGITQGHLVSLQQPSALEHTLHFFTRCHMALIGPAFHPHSTLQVHIRFVQPIWHRHHQHQALGGLQVVGLRVQRRAHMLAGRIADELVQTPHRCCIKSSNAAIIIHTQKHRSSTAVGKCSQLGRHAVGIGGVALELVAAVFTKGQCFQEVGFGHL